MLGGEKLICDECKTDFSGIVFLYPSIENDYGFRRAKCLFCFLNDIKRESQPEVVPYASDMYVEMIDLLNYLNKHLFKKKIEVFLEDYGITERS